MLYVNAIFFKIKIMQKIYNEQNTNFKIKARSVLLTFSISLAVNMAWNDTLTNHAFI